MVFLCPFLFYQEIKAEEFRITLVLFTGEVYLLDLQKNRIEPIVGQEVSSARFSEIELGGNSHAFLLKGSQMVELKAAGTHNIERVFEHQATLLDRSLLFLERLSSPRNFVSRSLVRGDFNLETGDDEIWFEDKWSKIALEDPEEKSQFSNQDLLVIAAWYQQKKKQARVAYILERLNLSQDKEQPFFRQLRVEALNAVTFTEISREVEQARLQQHNHLNLGRNLALLIGIEQYTDANWQSLGTPVRDVKELKQVLISDYRFGEKDILLLENATYEQMIEAFQELKARSNEKSSLLIYYAGHGFYPPDEEEGYWVPSDGGSPKTQKLFLSTSTILSKIKAINSRHTLVIADSCFSGSLIRRTRGTQIQSRYFWDLSKKKSRQIITSGGLEPVSDKGWGEHSVFAGKLIDLLKQNREEPLSASELALHLRKEVKETSFDQTPEYGRLYTADDENGEFFFVRKNQRLIPRNAETSLPSPQRKLNPDPVREKQPEELYEGIRLNFGGGFLGASLQYKFNYTDLNGKAQTENSNTTLSGALLQVGLGKTTGRMSFQLQVGYGFLDQAATECDEQDKGSYFCSSYAGAPVSGDFSAVAGYVTYNLLPKYKLDIDLGGGFKYQRYTFSKLLYFEDVKTEFLSMCLRADLLYHLSQWYFGGDADFCMRVSPSQGNFEDVENGNLSEIRIPFNMNIGFVAGYVF